MRITALLAAAMLATATLASAAQTPAPAPKRINVEQLQPKSIFPKTKLHVEYVVEVNRLGQVARVRSVKPSKNPPFDAQTYGNALQAFIRTPDGHAIVGSYRLIYDYDPKTQRVRRDVALVKRGGVNPNAKGAAIDMMEIAHRNGIKQAQAAAKAAAHAASTTPNPAPSVRRLPDLPQVMKTPGG